LLCSIAEVAAGMVDSVERKGVGIMPAPGKREREIRKAQAPNSLHPQSE
jgi:hypothetical protein